MEELGPVDIWISTPRAEILSPCCAEEGVGMLRFIERCGRVSHASEEAQTNDSWKRFIPAVVLGHGDWSIVEHATASVLFAVDRGITHELVRHRLCAFTQSSTRFINYAKSKPPEFICPPEILNRPSTQAFDTWERAVSVAEEAYRELLKLGLAPQFARSVLPNALLSRLVITTNLRNWRHILLMRTTKEAHPQMREVMIPLLRGFQERVPLLFDDIEPGSRQIDNLRRPR